MNSFKIYHSVDTLPNTWDSLVEHNLLLQTKYLKALESASPNNIENFYVGVFNRNELVGVAIIQCVQLYLKDMFRKTEVSCFKEFLKESVSKVLKGNILVVGNLTHTGQHALHFNRDKIEQQSFLNLICDSLDILKNDIKSRRNKTIRAIMFKDYFFNDTIHSEHEFFNRNNLHKVTVQPNMILNINSSWLQKDHYYNALNKKYKRRYKTAKNKLNGIVCSEMDLESIKTHSNRLHELYLNVSKNAKFNTFVLPKNHFYSLKLQLDNKFRVYGYYLNNVLVGFFTLMLNNTQLETYFLGYDSEHQYPNQLYLNMLYHMLEFAIGNNFKTVVYARTAMEIKSSVGAKPEAMFVYIKHTNWFMNAILKQLFSLMNPKQTWEERNPFTA